MIHSVRFTAVLDANVVYPVIIRDLLFWFAHYDLYTQNGVNIYLMNGKLSCREKVLQSWKQTSK
jgi:hypothetical protein